MPRPSAYKLNPVDVSPEIALRVYQRSQFQENGCMIWTGMMKRVRGYRYPQVTANGHIRLVRDISWIIKHDLPLPKAGVQAGCGNDRCVAPSHVRERIL